LIGDLILGFIRTAMSHEASDQKSIPLDRDIFFRSLIRELAGVLEEIVGIKDASGFVSISRG
jgi:hypothetical protein